LNKDIGSGSEVNWFVSGRACQRLPSVDFAHGDPTGGEQLPEQHGCGLGRGQHCLGFDPAFELLAEPFDCVARERRRRQLAQAGMRPHFVVVPPWPSRARKIRMGR